MTETLYRHSVAVQFRHCEPAGLVFYPRLLDEAEGAIEAWMTLSLGESYRDWIYNERRGLPRVKVECEFVKPCRMGDALTLVLRLAKVGRSSLDIRIEGEVDGELRFRFAIVVVNMALETARAVPFTDAFRAKLERYRALSAREA
jgi:4-hydroxybenzoyl-CoA thioesterase